MEKKTIPLGVKIICIILILQIASVVIFSSISIVLLKLPNDIKAQFLQTSEFRVALNITTIEQFDKFCKMGTRNLLNPYNFSILLINLILLFGLLKLKKWARIWMVIFSCYPVVFAIWSLWNRPSLNLAQHTARFISIILYCAIIIYLTHSKVKEYFEPGGPNV